MRLIHLISGVLLALIFLLTGQYMHIYLNHMVGVPDGVRLLYRTRHIFILFSGLLNFGLAAYVVTRRHRWQRVFQCSGSILIISASLLFVLAFFYDSTRGDLSAPLSHWAVYAISIGTLSHLFGGAGNRKPDS